MIANIQKLMNRNKEIVIETMFPDTCKIYPNILASPTITGPGVITAAATTARSWRGSTDIPCRIDLSRAFRPGQFPAQPVEVDEFNLHIPADCDVRPADHVHCINPVSGSNTIMVIRKMKDLSLWDVTRECTITELGVDESSY